MNESQIEQIEAGDRERIIRDGRSLSGIDGRQPAPATDDDPVLKKYDRESIAAKDSGYIIYRKNGHAQLAYMHVSFIRDLVIDVQFFIPQTDPAEDEPYEIDAPDFWCKLDFDAYLASIAKVLRRISWKAQLPLRHELIAILRNKTDK